VLVVANSTGQHAIGALQVKSAEFETRREREARSLLWFWVFGGGRCFERIASARVSSSGSPSERIGEV